MNKLLTSIRDIAILVVVVFVIVQWQERNLTQDDGSIKVPDKQLVSLGGKVEPLAKEGERTLVYFFAPWCSVCELSINSLDGIQTEDLRIVRVALDYETKNQVDDFVSRNEVEGEVLLGSDQLKTTFNVPGYPTYYILDENKRVVAHSFGFSTNWGIRLKNYLSENDA